MEEYYKNAVKYETHERNKEVIREKRKTIGERCPKAGGQLLQTRQAIRKLNSPSGEEDESGNTS